MKALQKLTKGKKYGIFLDFEGTQFSHEIIAIGAVKCKLTPNGHIIQQKNYPTYKAYVKCLGQIGRIVTQLTSITEDILKQGITLEQMFDDFSAFLSVDPKEYVFFVFGSNDHKMIVDSISYLYLRGKVTKTDFNKAKMAANLIYDNNGYQQAQNLNHQAGRDQYN